MVLGRVSFNSIESSDTECAPLKLRAGSALGVLECKKFVFVTNFLWVKGVRDVELVLAIITSSTGVVVSWLLVFRAP